MLDGEEKIIIDAIKGEASAFGLLYDKYQPQIYRFIYLKVGQREEAEDLTHQVFLNAWKNIEKYQFKGFPFSSWLYQISRNEVIDYYRTKKQDADIEKIPEPEIIDPTERKIDLNFQMNVVRRAIARLGQEQQDILIMRFIEEMSPEEVAVIIGKPAATVRVLQHRALKKLRDLLEENKND